MFGADGKQLASYAPIVTWTNTQTQLTVSFGITSERAYFGGKLVAQLASGGYQSASIYGEDRSGQPGNDTVRFATYTRDSATGNDYADQRYYSSALGRFLTPDPSRSSARATNPQSWNRYFYVLGDPANHRDPNGLDGDDDDFGGHDGSILGDDDDQPGQTGAVCDASQHSCQPPCVAADGFTPLPGPFCPIIPPISPQQSAPGPPDPNLLCFLQETAYVQSYLTAHDSPLAAYAGLIVAYSDLMDIDDRFIVALAGIESGYGKHLGWGPYNAWNNGAHKTPSNYYVDWTESIIDTVQTLNNSTYS